MCSLALFAVFVLLGSVAEGQTSKGDVLPVLGVVIGTDGNLTSLCVWTDVAGFYDICNGVNQSMFAASSPTTSTWVVVGATHTFFSRDGKNFLPAFFEPSSPFVGPPVDLIMAGEYFLLLTRTNLHVSSEGSLWISVPNASLPNYDNPPFSQAGFSQARMTIDPWDPHLVIAGTVGAQLVIWSVKIGNDLPTNPFVYTTPAFGLMRGVAVIDAGLLAIALVNPGTKQLGIVRVSYLSGQTFTFLIAQSPYNDPFAVLMTVAPRVYFFAFENVTALVSVGNITDTAIAATSPSSRLIPVRGDIVVSWKMAMLSGWDGSKNNWAVYVSPDFVNWRKSFDFPLPVTGLALRQFVTSNINNPTRSAGIVNGSAIIANGTVVDSGASVTVNGDVVQLRGASVAFQSNVSLSVSGTTYIQGTVSQAAGALLSTGKLCIGEDANIRLTGTIDASKLSTTPTTTETFTLATYSSVSTYPGQPVNVAIGLSLPTGVSVVSSTTNVGSTSLTVAVTLTSPTTTPTSSGLSTAAIIGIAVGCGVAFVAIAAIIIGLIVYHMRDKRQMRELHTKISVAMNESQPI